MNNNNELVQMIRDLRPLSMWLEIRFMSHAYRKNSVVPISW